jgi:hypothetical protein
LESVVESTKAGLQLNAQSGDRHRPVGARSSNGWRKTMRNNSLFARCSQSCVLSLSVLASCAKTPQVSVGPGPKGGPQLARSSATDRPDAGRALVQIADPMKISRRPTTDDVILARLEKTLEEIPPSASVPRIALGDVAYPRSQQELEALGGFGLLLVTVVSHNGRELPVERVEARLGDQVGELPLVNSRVIRMNEGRMSRVFGGYRFDGVYLLPVSTTRANSSVVVYLRGGSATLEPLRFPPPPDQDNFPRGLNFDWALRKPDVDALLRLINDEFPLVPAKVRE